MWPIRQYTKFREDTKKVLFVFANTVIRFNLWKQMKDPFDEMGKYSFLFKELITIFAYKMLRQIIRS